MCKGLLYLERERNVWSLFPFSGTPLLQLGSNMLLICSGAAGDNANMR